LNLLQIDFDAFAKAVRLYDVSLYTDWFFGESCEKLCLPSVQSSIVKPCRERVRTQGWVKLDTEGKGK
jgi:hypothetical protein